MALGQPPQYQVRNCLDWLVANSPIGVDAKKVVDSFPPTVRPNITQARFKVVRDALRAVADATNAGKPGGVSEAQKPTLLAWLEIFPGVRRGPLSVFGEPLVQKFQISLTQTQYEQIQRLAVGSTPPTNMRAWCRTAILMRIAAES